MSTSSSTLLQVSVGQAGGQVGALCSRYMGPPTHDGHGALFIDSEPKVVSPLVTEGNPQRIPFLPPSAAIWDVNGRGNNWAWGFTNAASRLGTGGGVGSTLTPTTTTTAITSSSSSMTINSGGIMMGGAANRKKKLGSAPLLERAMTAIRKHADCLDRVDSIVLIHSLGGGTGSGLGSRLLQSVRDEFPKAILTTAVVAPFSAGDTPLQHYNTVLSLACASEHADAIMFFDNDDVLRRARMRVNALGGSGSSNSLMGVGASASAIADARARKNNDRSQVDTRGLNEIIAEAISGVVMPTRHRKKWKGKRTVKVGRHGTGGTNDVGPGWYDVRKDEDEKNDEEDEGGGFDGKVVEGGKDFDSISKEPKKKFSSYSSSAASSSSSSQKFRSKFSTSGTDEDDEEDENGARGGWISASVKSSASTSALDAGKSGRNTAQAAASSTSSSSSSSSLSAAAAVEALLAGNTNTSVSGSGAGLVTSSSSSLSSPVGIVCPFDAAGFVQDLVFSPSHKFLDIRCVVPCAPNIGSGRGSSASSSTITVDSPCASWISLAENMVDALPRYDKASRTVTTFTSRLIGRGASQTDCDSVDPSLPSSPPKSSSNSSSSSSFQKSSSGNNSGGGAGARIGTMRTSPVGMKPIPPHWPGLPTTNEWERVSMMITRAQTYAPLAIMDTCRSSLLSPIPVYTASSSSLIPRPAVRSLTLASNSDVFVAPLFRTLTRAEELLSVRAYIHWYERYGVDHESITNALGSLLDIAEAYRPGGFEDAKHQARAIMTVSRSSSSSSSSSRISGSGGGLHGEEDYNDGDNHNNDDDDDDDGENEERRGGEDGGQEE